VLARGKARREEVALAPARVPVMMIAEPDDGRPPHLRRRAGFLLEDRNESFAIFSHACLGDAVEETGDAGLRLPGLQFRHGEFIADTGTRTGNMRRARE